MITTVLLFGSLGERFGHEWKLDVLRPSDVIDAISVKFPRFRQAILDMQDVDFGVEVGGEQIPGERLTFPNAGKTITITPVVRGSDDSKGWIQIVAGVVLIAAGIIFSEVLGPFAGPLIGLGVSLVLGGVAQLLTPSPSTDSDTQTKTKASYQFSTIINTNGQGECVPAFYGGDTYLGMWIGSAVVSAAYENVDIIG